MGKFFIQNGMISRFDFMDNQEFLPLPTVCALLNDNEEKYDKLAEKFVIVSKALELCERHHIGFENATHKDQVEWRETRVRENIEYFINKAKEIINGYKPND